MVKQKVNQEKNDNMKNGRKNIGILKNIWIRRKIIAIILFLVSIFLFEVFIIVATTFGMHYGTPPYRPKVE